MTAHARHHGEWHVRRKTEQTVKQRQLMSRTAHLGWHIKENRKQNANIGRKKEGDRKEIATLKGTAHADTMLRKAMQRRCKCDANAMQRGGSRTLPWSFSVVIRVSDRLMASTDASDINRQRDKSMHLQHINGNNSSSRLVQQAHTLVRYCVVCERACTNCFAH